MNLEGEPRALEARLAALDEAGLGDAPELPMVLNELGWALRVEQPDRAAELVRRAETLARAGDDRRALAWALRNLAYFRILSPDPAGTLELAEEARALFTEVGDELGLATTWDLLATVHEALGDYSTAMQLALDSLGLARKLGYRRGVGWALSSVGGILAATGDAVGARRHLEESLAEFEALGYPLGVRRVCGRLGSLALAQGEPMEARRYTERALALPMENPLFAAAPLAMLGEVHEALGELSAARAAYEEALRVLRAQAAASFTLPIRLGRARTLGKLGELAAARDELREIAAIAGERSVAPLEARAREQLADVLERLGDASGALAELRRYVAIREQELGHEARTKLKHLEIRLETEAARKDAEIHRLRYVELERAQAELLEAEKLAVLGNLAAGLTHELNTPVGVLRSNIDTAARALERLVAALEPSRGGRAGAAPEFTTALEALGALRASSAQALERIAEITTSLGRFVHLDEATQQRVDIVAGLDSALTLIVGTVAPGVTVKRRGDSSAWVWGHAAALNQAFLALLRHSIETAGEPGAVDIEVECQPDRVRIALGNNGAGLPEAAFQRLFDAQFEPNAARVRFRLGLTSAAATLRKHGGTLAVGRSPMGGLSMAVALPAAPPAAP